MSNVWKIIWTIFIIVFGVAGIYSLGDLVDSISTLINDGTENLVSNIWSLFVSWLIIIPLWFVWKGTKLIPIVFNIVVRFFIVLILIMIPILAGANFIPDGLSSVLLVVDVIAIWIFALIGVWFKS